MEKTEEKIKKTFTAIGKELGHTNTMQSPRLVKVVFNVGVGSLKDKKKIETIKDRLAKITGQRSAEKGAKKSVASFKVREGDVVGLQTTLRGARMYDFIDKLVNVAFPRTKDFRGISTNGIDEMGNYTIGIKEHVIFPETSDEDIKDVFGLAITIVTTAKNKKEALSFLKYLGFPFKEE